MEELLIVIFQFTFEILLQVLAELPWDLFLGSRQTTSTPQSNSGLWIVLSLIAGGSIGGLSLFVFPTALLHWRSARMANLIVAPTVSALASLYFSRSFTARRGNRSNPNIRAICAACFTFALAIIRFTYASRP